jgi:hypothetical protein
MRGSGSGEFERVREERVEGEIGGVDLREQMGGSSLQRELGLGEKRGIYIETKKMSFWFEQKKIRITFTPPLSISYWVYQFLITKF